MLLKEKVAIVTGSSRGIGRGIALRFAREGARVVVCGRGDDTHAVVAEIRAAGGIAHGVVCDVTKHDDVQRLFDEALSTFGTVDILVNNAQTPTGKGSSGPFLRMTAEGWDTYVKTNMGALFYCTHRAAEIMCARRKGSIVNISTNATQRVHRRSIAYDSVKGAMDVFTMAVAVDLAPWGVRVPGGHRLGGRLLRRRRRRLRHRPGVPGRRRPARPGPLPERRADPADRLPGEHRPAIPAQHLSAAKDRSEGPERRTGAKRRSPGRPERSGGHREEDDGVFPTLALF
jgi:NAD(P)-dependent dehydrogenase (short-subunit alcohol dehydrogenase family)